MSQTKHLNPMKNDRFCYAIEHLENLDGTTCLERNENDLRKPFFQN